jgi:hypothetical protein
MLVPCVSSTPDTGAMLAQNTVASSGPKKRYRKNRSVESA